MEFAKSASKYLGEMLLRPSCLVHVGLDDDHPFDAIRFEGSFYSVSPDGAEAIGQAGYEVIPFDLSRWSNILAGMAAVVLARGNDGQLTNTKNGVDIVFGGPAPKGIDAKTLVPGYAGNRLSVNGIMVSFQSRKIVRFPSGQRLALILDIDARGVNEIEFDVSRERLTARGGRFLRGEVQSTLLRAMSESGVMERMASELRLSLPVIPHGTGELQQRLLADDGRPDPLRDLFSAVKDLLPGSDWPRGIHVQIANKLGISASLVGRVITKLLESGVISHPASGSHSA